MSNSNNISQNSLTQQNDNILSNLMPVNNFNSFLILLIIVITFLSYKRGIKKGKILLSEQLDRNFYEIYNLVHSSIDRSEQSIQQLSDTFNSHSITPNGYITISINDEDSYLQKTDAGYVMRIESKFEHRFVAESILGRSLAPNEVVHHIYAPDITNNNPQNLCVMDRDDHDLFHSYLDREKELKHKYPSLQLQRDLLRNKFGGILLEEAITKKTCFYKPIPSSRYNQSFSSQTTHES